MRRDRLGVWTVLGMLLVTVSSGYAVDVIAMGDSMMRTMARVLRRDMEAKGIQVESAVTIGSGLARLDLFDWHAEAQAVMQKHKAGTVVVMMGANDNQPMRTSAGIVPFQTPAWEMEYGRRVGQLMDLLLAGGAERVIWLGLPCMREAQLNQDVIWMSRIVAQQAESREAVIYYPTKPIFCAGDGSYSSYLSLPNGMPLEVRASDGIHLNRQGAEHLAAILEKEFFAK